MYALGRSFRLSLLPRLHARALLIPRPPLSPWADPSLTVARAPVRPPLADLFARYCSCGRSLRPPPDPSALYRSHAAQFASAYSHNELRASGAGFASRHRVCFEYLWWLVVRLCVRGRRSGPSLFPNKPAQPARNSLRESAGTRFIASVARAPVRPPLADPASACSRLADPASASLAQG